MNDIWWIVFDGATGASLTIQSLLFGEKGKQPPKKARIFLSAEPLKILAKERKNAQKAQGE